ncbi:hypothetical protein GOBAR_DD23643 [Gossypium barbadense]|nr:hypothetical protein GOBAR_DD23643 [Gossypium barbadense]
MVFVRTSNSNPIELSWDLSLWAPSHRALSTNSIWLREEDKGVREGCWMENRLGEMGSRNGIPRGSEMKTSDPIQGFSLEGKGTVLEKP